MNNSDGVACDSDSRTPPATARCAPCGDGLLCVAGTCQRPCDPSEAHPSGACACTGQRCNPIDGGVPDATATALCRPCAELGFASGDGVNGCCDRDLPGVTVNNASVCCRETDSMGCTSGAQCCGGACEPGATGVCRQCLAALQPCTDAWQCCASGSAATPGSGDHGTCTAHPSRPRRCCPAGFGGCDPDPNTLCSTDLLNNVNHCGACGHVCTVAGANAHPQCYGGACGSACNAGFGDCDGLSNNGCEVNLLDDTMNCGSCGNRCEPGMICHQATCRAPCPPGQDYCGGTTCVSLSETPNCGMCGRTCTSTQQCSPAAGGAHTCRDCGEGATCSPGALCCQSGISCNSLNGRCVRPKGPCASCDPDSDLCSIHIDGMNPYRCPDNGRCNTAHSGGTCGVLDYCADCVPGDTCRHPDADAGSGSAVNCIGNRCPARLGEMCPGA